ncbi:unnamed protein product [Medioppia subpectinata]|uniref:Uncharacterized protein n=1 Tax=Medioppia subpectinata TaxID=1979941 RepID=A0A7R9Q9E1_9ACAR|nr:unnamed protein product [Medioppia subpectinata]CAG2116292.1 unnamed protein product [Medioppia subpectinata]
MILCMTLLAFIVPIVMSDVIKADCLAFGREVKAVGGVKNYASMKSVSTDKIYNLLRDCFMNDDGFRYKRQRILTSGPEPETGSETRQQLWPNNQLLY